MRKASVAGPSNQAKKAEQLSFSLAFCKHCKLRKFGILPIFIAGTCLKGCQQSLSESQELRRTRSVIETVWTPQKVCICIHVHLLHFLHSIEYNMMQVLLNALHLSLRKTQSNHGLFSSKSHIVKSSQNTPYAAMPKGFESAAAT